MFLVHKRGHLKSLDDLEDFKLVKTKKVIKAEDGKGEDREVEESREVNESGRHTIFVVSLVGKPLQHKVELVIHLPERFTSEEKGGFAFAAFT